MKSPHPIIALSLARLREFTRQPEALFWVYFFPVLMVVVLGIAFRNKPPAPIAVDILDNGHAASVMQQLTEDAGFKPRIVSEAEGVNRLRTSKSNLLVVAEASTGERDSVGETSWSEVQYRFDPDRPGSLAARDRVDQRLQVAAGRRDVISTTDVQFDEPGGQYVDFLVPGLLGLGLMGGGMWGVGFAIVDMRIRKLLKRFMATPMKRSHFLMGMMVSRLVFMWPQIIVLLVFSHFAFGVQIHGNWLAIGGVLLLGAIEFAGIGLLVASRAKTLETVSGLMNLIMLPMWTLSGIFFSYENFPEIVQPLIRWLPLTPVIDALRALMMDGKPIAELLPELGIMTFWSVLAFVVALLVFRWNE